MKYASLIIVCSLLLTACTNNSGRGEWNFDGTETVSLMDTEQFLPVQEKDKDGVVLPYEATANPYAAIKGRISKEAVTAYIEARRAFNSEQYQRAEELLLGIVEKEDELSGPWVMRGDIAFANGDIEKAMDYFAKAIDINVINTNAYLRLARAQREQGLFHHAQNTYARALAHWPDAPETHLNLGILYDIYLNDSLQAQAHMEAYLFLQAEPIADANTWLNEVRSRTGLASMLRVRNAEGELEMLTTEAYTESTNSSATTSSAKRALIASESE